MRIGIDVCCWSNPRGFGRYTREIVSNLVDRFAREHRFILIADETTASEMPLLPGAGVRAVTLGRRPIEAASARHWRSPMDLLRLGAAARSCRCDVIFFPAAYTWYPVPGRVPVVVAFHDAMTEKAPGLFFSSRRAQLFWQAKIALARRRAAAVIAPSESARRDVAASLKIPLENIVSTGEAAAANFAVTRDPLATERVLNDHHIPQGPPIVLYVGGISPHKNLDRLLRAMALLEQEGRPWHLVLVGEFERDAYLGCYREVSQLAQQLGLGQKVTFTGFVPEADLVALYNAAALLVLPSLDEGFGLPLVEAMACGLPVAASNRGSIPEVMGNAGLLFDPEQPGDIARTIARLLDEKALRDDLSRKGLSRAAEFSWSAAADRTMAVLEACGRG